jgi:hypothetical protein
MTNAIIIVFTLFSAPVDVAANAPITLQPLTSISITARSEKEADVKRAWTQCNRFVAASKAADMVGYCAAAE